MATQEPIPPGLIKPESSCEHQTCPSFQPRTVSLLPPRTGVEGRSVLATRLGAIPLPVGSPRIRNKRLTATTALTPGSWAAHDEPNLRRSQRRRKRKRRRSRKSRPKKEEEILERSHRRKCPGRKRIFKPLVPPLIPPQTALWMPVALLTKTSLGEFPEWDAADSLLLHRAQWERPP